VPAGATEPEPVADAHRRPAGLRPKGILGGEERLQQRAGGLDGDRERHLVDVGRSESASALPTAARRRAPDDQSKAGVVLGERPEVTVPSVPGTARQVVANGARDALLDRRRQASEPGRRDAGLRVEDPAPADPVERMHRFPLRLAQERVFPSPREPAAGGEWRRRG